MATMAINPQVPALQVENVNRAAKRHVISTICVAGGILLYLVFSVIQFDIANVTRKWNADRGSMFLLDTYAHKDHVTMKWQEPEKVVASFEGGYRYIYDTAPWLDRDYGKGGTAVTFENGGKVVFFKDRVEMQDWPGEERTYIFKIDINGRPYVEGLGEASFNMPPWIRVSENKIEVRPSLFERIQVYKSKVEVHRYAVGWKYFWFDFDSLLRDYSFGETLNLIFVKDRVDPEQSNLNFVLDEFLNNEIWFHGVVLFSLVETVLMALLGTMIASMIGLPLAFFAAANITPFAMVRFGLRRLFDCLRGIDTLIWSLVLLRAFGPGLFTGIFAIALTDIGTLGKLMSEAIENSESKQKEGVASTGASRLQQHRFGIVPQILPVFISQSLYYLESNTRSAVIIGAMGAGGIGLQFLGALQTGNDFENVAYMAILVLLTVIIMDNMSARLRRSLIGISEKSK